MTELTTINPFGNAPATQPGALATQQTDSARAIAEVQASLMIARMNPRDQRKAMDRILNACTRETLAKSAIYAYARGGSSITGPSIRLAEAVAQQWGNIQFGIRELSNHGGKSEVQAFAWDVETNTRREVTFSVPHIRYTRKGAYKLEDPRDVYELIANQGARRLRACILAVIPGDVMEAAVEQCQTTIANSVDVSPEAIKKIIETFEERFGINKEQIEKYCQCRLEAIRPAQVIRLRQIWQSLKDGMSSPSDWFEPVEKPEAIENKKESSKTTLKDKLKQRKQEEEATEVKEEQPEEQAATPTIDEADLPDTGADPEEPLF